MCRHKQHTIITYVQIQGSCGAACRSVLQCVAVCCSETIIYHMCRYTWQSRSLMCRQTQHTIITYVDTAAQPYICICRYICYIRRHAKPYVLQSYVETHITYNHQICTSTRQLQSSVLQRVAACCSVLQRVAVKLLFITYVDILGSREAVCCSVLQCAAVKLFYITYVGIRGSREAPLSFAHCSTLQHTATHCNTLRHATLCKLFCPLCYISHK